MRPHIACLAGALVACISLTWTETAAALDPSGTAVAVVQATNATGPGGSRVLADTKPVYSGDRIATGGVGQAQILFEDQTRLVVGANSSVVIDRFVLAADPSASGATMRFARGAFRFMTGTGASQSYSLVTPTATIGIRGTEFDISVGVGGTAVVVFDGAVEVCNSASGQCATVDRSCGAIIAKPDGALELPETQPARAALINASFPLTAKQDGLRPDFRVNTRNCSAGSRASRGNERPAPARKATEPSKPHNCGYGHDYGNTERKGKKSARKGGKDGEGDTASRGPSAGKSGKGKKGKGKKGRKGKKGGKGRGR